MSIEKKRIEWILNDGRIYLSMQNRRERIIAFPVSFFNIFKSEIVESCGESTFKMVLRNIIKDLNEKQYQYSDKELNWDLFEDLNNNYILPIDYSKPFPIKEISSINDNSREFFLSTIKLILYTVRFIQKLLKSLRDVLTLNGTRAIINLAGKKGGIAFCEELRLNSKWKNSKDLVFCMTEILSHYCEIFGFYKARIINKLASDGNPLFLLKAMNGFETDNYLNSESSCMLTTAFLNGVCNSFSKISYGVTADVKEVKCVNQKNKYCLYVLKFKPEGSDLLNWREFEREWKKFENEF